MILTRGRSHRVDLAAQRGYRRSEIRAFGCIRHARRNAATTRLHLRSQRRRQALIARIHAPDRNNGRDPVALKQRVQRFGLAHIIRNSQKTLSPAMANVCAVLPWLTSSTPRRRASTLKPATSALDCGPITTRTPSRANRPSSRSATSASPPASATTSRTR